MTKKHPIDFYHEMRRLSIMIHGGVFRDPLPGRGITRIIVYQPMYETIGKTYEAAVSGFVKVLPAMVQLANDTARAGLEIIHGLAEGMKQDE